MKVSVLSVLAYAAVAHGWALTFYNEPSCAGEELSGVSYPDGSACNHLTTAEANTQSIVVSHSSNSDSKYEVVFYGGSKCSGKPVGTVTSEVCFPDEEGVVKSYIVKKKPKKREVEQVATISKRSPVEIQRSVEYLIDSTSLDLVARDEEDLAEPKSVGFAQPRIDLDEYHVYLSASLSTVVTAASFASLVTGCIGVNGAGALSSASCGLSLATTSISFLATLYHAYKGYKAIRATLRNNNIELGIRRPRNKRDEGEDPVLTLSHNEYMEWVLDQAGLQGREIGLHKRSESHDATPVYEFEGHDSMLYHFSMSARDDGSVRHTISFAHDATIEKRAPGYEGVKVNGGLDVDGCQRKAGRTTDLPTSASSAYSYFYQDLQCLINTNTLLNGKTNYIQGDIFDKSGHSVLTYGMAVYKSTSQANEATAQPICSNVDFYFSQTCVN